MLKIRLPTAAPRGILPAMHRPISVVGLSVFLLLFILAIPSRPAHAARLTRAPMTLTSATSQPPSQGLMDGTIYTVQPSDTLWDIAAAHGISAATLIAANGLANPRLLHAGQSLFVPARPPAVPQNHGRTVPAGGIAPASPSLPTPASTPEVNSEVPTLPPETSALLSLINEKRVASGLRALVWSPELASAAQSHAADCAQRNQGSHIGSDAAPLKERLARVGLTARWASENWANAQGVEHAFLLWWNESAGRDPHRRNILNPKHDRIGIGIAPGSWGTYFVADFAGP